MAESFQLGSIRIADGLNRGNSDESFCLGAFSFRIWQASSILRLKFIPLCEFTKINKDTKELHIQKGDFF